MDRNTRPPAVNGQAAVTAHRRLMAVCERAAVLYRERPGLTLRRALRLAEGEARAAEAKGARRTAT